MAPGKRRATGSPGSRLPAPPPPGSPRFLPCPTCGKSFGSRILNHHAWACAGAQQQKQQQQKEGQSLHSNGIGDKEGDGGGKFVCCPMCSKYFPLHAIEGHAWACSAQRSERCEKDSHTPSGPSPKQGPAYAEAAPATGTKTVVSESGGGGTPTKGRQQHTQDFIRSGKGAYGSPIHGKNGPGRTTPEIPSSSDIAAAAAVTLTVPTATGSFREGVNALTRLMEAGKRAVEVERETKIVPPDWPVERIEDILPSDKADSLLACLLQESRGWTSHPWYNNNGVEGRSHTRSHIYRIPIARDVQSSSLADGDRTNLMNIPKDTQTSAGVSSADFEGSAGRSGSGLAGAASGMIDRNARVARALDASADDNDNMFHSFREIRKGQKSLSNRAEVGAFGAPRRHQESQRDRAIQRSAPDSRAGSSKLVSTTGDRRATYEELMLDENSDLAPEELLEIVPLVVQVVRRRQQQRLEAGLSGKEGLNWTPNFCICHVYDDHRSHIGPHSDTLSNIGPQAIVVGVSLGAKRVFVVQKSLPWGVKTPPAGSGFDGGKKSLDMPHNSAIVMWAGCQERYKHSVPAMIKGVGTHPVSGTKRISITLRERMENLPPYLMPIPDCRCGVPASLKARVLASGRVDYLYQCDRGQGQCGFTLSKGRGR